MALDAAGFSGPDGLLYTRGSSMDDGVDTTEERLGKLADALDTGARHSMAGGGGGGGVGLGWKDGVVRQAEVPPGVPPPVFFAQEPFGHRAQARGHRPPPAEVLSLGKRLCEAHDETTAVLAEAERLSTALVPEDSVTVSHAFGRASLPLGRASLRVSAARDSIGTEISGMSEASDEYVGADARVRLQPPPLRTPVRNVPRWPQLAMNVLATVEAVESLYQGEVDAGALRPDRLSVALANEGIDAAAAARRRRRRQDEGRGARRRRAEDEGRGKIPTSAAATAFVVAGERRAVQAEDTWARPVMKIPTYGRCAFGVEDFFIPCTATQVHPGVEHRMGDGWERLVKTRRAHDGASPVICGAGAASSSSEMSPGRNISSRPLPGATIGRQMSGTTRKSQSTGPWR